VTLVLQGDESASAFAAAIGEVAREVEAATDGAVQVRRGDGVGPPDLPALTLATSVRRNLHFLAVPDGSEAAPFLEALQALCEPVGPGDAPWPDEPRQPAELLVFVTAGCPHCPQAVRAAIALALVWPLVEVTVVDVAAFPLLAQRHGVRSAPTTVLDRELAVVGLVSAAKLERLVLDRGSAAHRRAVLLSCVEVGRFEEAGERLCGPGGAEAFGDLWRSASMSGRMGLLLAAEEAVARAPSALDPAVPSLLSWLESAGLGVRGDTVQLLGVIACPTAAQPLAALCRDPDPDLAEAAAEALARVGGRAAGSAPG
jgi:hypothetical protein